MCTDYFELKDRAVLVKGPCQNSAFFELDNYHRRNWSAGTKNCHVNAVKGIMESPERQYQYWLIVFPIGVILDNVILSGDPGEVSKRSIFVTEKYETVESKTLFLNWVISCRDGGYSARREAQGTLADDLA